MKFLKLIVKIGSDLAANGHKSKITTALGIIGAILTWFAVHGVDLEKVLARDSDEWAKLGSVVFVAALGWISKADITKAITDDQGDHNADQ